MLIRNKDNSIINNVSTLIWEANKMKEDKMYRKMYLQEKINRLKAEMTIMQDRFAINQQELQRTEEELGKVAEEESIFSSENQEIEE
jgi:uncharacterized small protein (DUF1192 family)